MQQWVAIYIHHLRLTRAELQDAQPQFPVLILESLQLHLKSRGVIRLPLPRTRCALPILDLQTGGFGLPCA